MLILAVLCISPPATANDFASLFGYTEEIQEDLRVFPQWIALVGNTAPAVKDNPSCDGRHESADCPVITWQQLLAELRNKPAAEQLDAVNEFVNRLEYVGDQENYGQADYWAPPRQFLTNGGDCEDYAILKFISLRQLGWSVDAMRLVVVQDTKLRQPHAVLAVATQGDVLILDNQSRKILSQGALPHYAPIYSLSNERWWLHLPDSLPGKRLLATTR